MNPLRAAAGIVLFAAAVVIALFVGARIFIIGEANEARARPHFGCRAPAQEGDLTVITINVRSGELVAECSYATTRPSKPRKGA